MSGAATLVPVLPNHRFDEAALSAYLTESLPGFRPPYEVMQFQGGQSNPTYCLLAPDSRFLTTHDARHLAAQDARYVLRKKPPGTLLQSAHAVDREYRVMSALAGTDVPVPHMRLMCDDSSVIGTPFYVMDHVDGRIYTDIRLRDVPKDQRGPMYDDMARVMAALHRVDWRAAGLEGFGRPDGYIARQIDRWTKQYLASKPEPVASMDALIAWLPSRVPADHAASVVHGDFRLGNLMFHSTEPRVVAVLDWELATIGHPLADLAYNCLPWHLPEAANGIEGAITPGLPDEAAYVAAYCRHAGISGVPDLAFFTVFSMFRWAAIAAGVYRRALDGNAADARGLEIGAKFRVLADRGWALAKELG